MWVAFSCEWTSPLEQVASIHCIKYEVIAKRKQESLQAKAMDTLELRTLEDVGDAVLSLYQAASSHINCINHGFPEPLHGTSNQARTTRRRYPPTSWPSGS